MVSCTRTSDINFIKPLYRLAQFFAIVPPYNAPQGTKKYFSYGHAILVVAFILTMTIISFYGKITKSFHYQPLTVVIIDIMSNSALTISVVNAIIRSTFRNSNKFRSFTKLFLEIDKLMYNHKISCATCYKLYLEIIFSHIFILILFSYNAYFWKVTNEPMSRFAYFLKDVIIYLHMITVLLIYNYIKSLHHRFKRLNAYLKSMQNAPQSENNMYSNSIANESRETMSKNINDAREIFTQLNALIRIFNDLFGWQIFFLCAIVVLVVLERVNYAVVTVELGIITAGSIQIEVDFVSLNLCWCTTLALMVVVVATACDGTTQEGQRTSVLCYEFLLSVPTESKNAEIRIFRKELILLAQQSSQQSPYFSAAGFFIVNYTMIFGLFGMITSYVIVLIQINNK